MTKINIKIYPDVILMDGKEILIEINTDSVSAGEKHCCEKKTTVFDYIETLIQRMKDDGRAGTAANYNCAMRSFRKLCGDEQLTFSDFDEATARHYEAELKRGGVKMNTISFYMRTLRAVYNMAVSEGLTDDRHPFRSVYTGIGHTDKRAVTMDTIRQISRLTTKSKPMAMARDMFMFSFYTRGMAFVDMAYLTKDNLKDGVLTYTRKKTGQTLSIKWEKCMQDIVDTYDKPDRSYLLPIIRDSMRDSRTQYKTRQSDINLQLRRITQLLNLDNNLTMYVARHSWASIAKDLGIPLNVISEALGHNSAKTTQIYLHSIDRNVIDKANAKIIKRM